ncbi:MAG: hypothetical protein DDT18_00879 [Actinobacteria bacterium]|nr:hypothetical protein [Actinomycetota bacterium]
MVFKIETKGIDGIIKGLDPKLVERATVPALNRTVASVKTAIKRMLRQVYTLKARVIDRALSIRKASYVNPQAEIRSDFLRAGGVRKAFPMFAFEVRPTEISVRARTPVSVRIKKEGGWRRVKGAPHLTGQPFVAQMRSGHRGVFQRIPGTRMAGKNKEKIQELYTFFVPQVLLSKRIRETVQQSVNEIFPKKFYEAYRFFRRR